MVLHNSVIIINTKSGKVGIKLNQIVYIKVSDKNSWIFLVNGEKRESTNAFGKIYLELPKPDFFKCHRSYIINCSYIKSFTNKGLIVDKNTIIPLSKKLYNFFVVNYCEFLLK